MVHSPLHLAIFWNKFLLDVDAKKGMLPLLMFGVVPLYPLSLASCIILDPFRRMRIYSLGDDLQLFPNKPKKHHILVISLFLSLHKYAIANGNFQGFISSQETVAYHLRQINRIFLILLYIYIYICGELCSEIFTEPLT